MKRALNIPIVEAEPEEVTEDVELTPNPEEAIQFQDKEPEPGDYVLVEYAGKDKKRHCIGLITRPKDGEDDFEVNFSANRQSMYYPVALLSHTHKRLFLLRRHQSRGCYLSQQAQTPQRDAEE